MEYKKIGKLNFHTDTPDELCRILCTLNTTHERVRVWYGDQNKTWEEEYDVIGYIGRSTGNISIPLIVYNERSLGGPGLLDDVIVKIARIKDGYVLWQAPHFREPNFTNVGEELFSNGKYWGSSRSEASAKRFCDFMNGKRFSK